MQLPALSSVQSSEEQVLEKKRSESGEYVSEMLSIIVSCLPQLCFSRVKTMVLMLRTRPCVLSLLAVWVISSFLSLGRGP